MNLARPHRGFTLIEMLVVISIVALLIGILLPALGAARSSARSIKCASNQRQLAIAWSLYAGEHRDLALPHRQQSGADRVYWYGAENSAMHTLDPDRGTLHPYLDANPGDRSVYECPTQPTETYIEQGQFGSFSSTYGYNAYGLAPSTTGYFDLVDQRWLRSTDIPRPSAQILFADTLIAFGSSMPTNSALLDPPMLFSRTRGWRINQSPTTAFRHNRSSEDTFGRTIAARADTSVVSEPHDEDAITNNLFGIGSISADNNPGYIQNERAWTR